jgi:hypothetical protein
LERLNFTIYTMETKKPRQHKVAVASVAFDRRAAVMENRNRSRLLLSFVIRRRDPAMMG